MYTAKIHSKSFDAGVLRVQVEFTNGVNSIIESCVPQDENGLKYWVRGRLSHLNFTADVDTKYPDDSDIIIDPVVVPPTPEEVAASAWLANYLRWVKIKTTLIDTGILTGNETKVVNLKTKVQNDLLPEYLGLI